MKTKPLASLLFLIVFAMTFIFAVNGCGPEQLFPEEPVVDQNDEEPDRPLEVEPVYEEPPDVTIHYWPWISYGHLDLSSGEVILGPDPFESDLGYIAEYTEAYSFDGLLIWLVDTSDVFEIEWVTLSFHVDYYDQDERLFELYYEFAIEDLQPEPGDDGLQELAVNLVVEQRGFEVAVKKVLLGKEQQSSFSDKLINYVGLEMEMRVVGKP